MNVILLAGILSSAGVVEAQQQEPEHSRVGLQAAAGSIAAAAGVGPALETGVRIRLAEHLAGTFDVGYGVLASGATAQDRWWLMPSLAVTFPVGRLRLDLGLGAGLGAASGYASVPAFVKAPFDPDWAFQLVPAVRLHAALSVPVSRRFTMFARVEAGDLFLKVVRLGIRTGENNDTFANDTWLHVALGGEFGL
jgi:hypothetical protein